MVPFSPTTNTELTTGKPITQDVMRRLRDDGYSKLPDSAQTNETDQNKVLAPDGAGGVHWKLANSSVPSFIGTFGANTSISIPIGASVKVTVTSGGRGGQGISTAGSFGQPSTTDDGTTVVSSAGSGGTGGNLSPSAGTLDQRGFSVFGGGYGVGGNRGSNTGSSSYGDGGSTRIARFNMASSTLTITIGTGGVGGSGGTSGSAGVVMVEY